MVHWLEFLEGILSTNYSFKKLLRGVIIKLSKEKKLSEKSAPKLSSLPCLHQILPYLNFLPEIIIIISIFFVLLKICLKINNFKSLMEGDQCDFD